jgi:ABC-type polysaccharide/polyol phosphate export permease
MEITLPPPRQHKPPSTIQWVWQYRALLGNLIAQDIKLQYRGAFLGLIWSLLNPVLLVVVYVIAFKFVLGFRLENYVLWLLTGVLHWQFFSSATISSTVTLINNANLIHNIHFPRIILPLAAVGSNTVHLFFTMCAYFLLFVPMGGAFWAGILLYPLILVLQIIFVTGISLSISILTLYFRDLRHLLDVTIRMLFWLTPIIYNFSQIPEWAHIWFRLNPMVSFILPYQEILYLHEIPSLANWGFMTVIAFCSLGLGYFLFWRLKPNMEDYL